MNNPELSSRNSNFRITFGFANFLRYFLNLRLTLLLIPIFVFLLLCATAVPQFFMWYSGAAVECFSTQLNCVVPLAHFIPWNIPVFSGGFFILIALSFVTRVLSWIVFEVSAQWASMSVYNKMIHALSHVRVTYFDQNPSSTILNKLMSDFEKIRVMGILRLGDGMNCLVEIFFIALLILFSNSFVAAIILPVLVLFFYLQSQVSPMLEHLSTAMATKNGDLLHRETDLIDGARIFSLFGKQNSLLNRIRSAFLNFYSAWYTHTKILAWHRFWLGFIILAYTTIVVIFLTVSLSENAITQAMAAVILTAIFRLAPTFEWLFNSTSVLSGYEANAKRVFELVDLPSELQTEMPQPRFESHKTVYVDSGFIEFKNFSMSYRSDSPVILNELNLKLKIGSKIGIIGRTGSGKSSIVQSLFRLAYVHSGDILIGNQSIYETDITQHRQQLGIVPQHPFLFCGSLRANLDRSQTCTNEKLLTVLKLTGLNYDLSFEIAEGGSNLSLGERQLICIARILASNKSIILMDEPTSSVDTETDARIQKILRTAFEHKTIITIAHRLETLDLYDEIIELQNGRVVFQGPPKTALARWRGV